MYSELFRPTDAGKYCKTFKHGEKIIFYPKNGPKRPKNGPKMSWFGMVCLVWLGYEPNRSELKPKI